jgi:hypothetical protein
MYYKLIRGYGVEDYIEIDEKELEKAYYCFLQKKDAIFSGGAIRGSQIMAIQPDYHKTMGWNRGYKLEALDYSDLREKGIDKKAQQQLETIKRRVIYLVENKKENLIGQNLEIPELDKPKFGEITKQLVGKFQI